MTILLTLVVLSVLILIHEAGHFLAARALGIRVLTFSLGFGPQLAGWTWKGTRFVLSAIPFGGYVRMKGDDPEHLQHEPDEFLSRPVHHRFLVVVAGPLANLLLGFVLFAFVYTSHGISTIPGTTVYQVEPHTPADSAGLRPFDRILAVDDHPVENWWDLDALLGRPGPHRLQILRDTDTLVLTFRTPPAGAYGIVPLVPPEIARVVPGSAAEQAGLHPGDRILRIDTLQVHAWDDLVQIISHRPGDTLTLWILRGSDTFRLRVAVAAVVAAEGDTVGRIGILAPTERVRLTPGRALGLAARKTCESVALTYEVLFHLLTGRASVKTIGGPVMIGKLVGESASMGWVQVLILMALISVNLGVINLLPIPALDGGHLTVYLVEVILRRPLPPRVQTRIQQVGFALLLLLMAFITLLDLMRLFGGG